MVRQQDWLKPHFATEAGQLISSIHAFVIDDVHRRILVDTCVGNDKARRMPRWNMLQTAFLDDLAKAGYPAEAIDTVLCTHLHVDHVGWNTRLVDGRWISTFPNARYLFGRIEFEHWSRGPDPAKTGDAPSAVADNVMECDAIYRDLSFQSSKPTCMNWWNATINSRRISSSRRRPDILQDMSASWCHHRAKPQSSPAT